MPIENISPNEHRIKDVGIDIVDEYECSCGWRSAPYYDGAEYAIGDWMKHVLRETGVAPEWPYRKTDAK